jgi:hypothetical protein
MHLKQLFCVRFTLIATAAFLMVAISPQLFPQKYFTVDAPGLGTPANQGVKVLGINDLGVVDGGYWDANNILHGFVGRYNGNLTTFDAPGAGTTGGGQGTWPQGINIVGAVTGNFTDDSYRTHGFLRTAGGKFQIFDAPGAGTGISANGNWLGTYPESISDFGVIAGYYIDPNDVWHGFVRNLNGKITTFDAPGAGTGVGQGTTVNYSAPSLNDLGTIAGIYIDADGVNHGYLRTRDGNFTLFDAPHMGTDPGQGTIPSSINLEGVVSTICADSYSHWHGCVRGKNGKFSMFDVFPAAPGEFTMTVPEQINNFGVVTGYVFEPGNYLLHGFVRTPDGKVTRIDDPNAGTDGYPQGTSGYVLNDLGMVAGNYTDSNYVSHGFVRLPK